MAKRIKLPQKIKLPKGVSEEQLLKIINGVVNRLAGKFKFGYHDIEDIKQQGRLYALECLKHYDNVRPLENFIWTHVRNRLFNYKRDNFERPEKPCLECPEDGGCYTGDKCNHYDNMECCRWHYNWKKRNTAKKNLMRPIELSSVSDETEDSMKTPDVLVDTLAHDEIFKIIDENMPNIFRKDWIMVYQNMPVSKSRRERLKVIIQQILLDRGIDVEKAW